MVMANNVDPTRRAKLRRAQPYDAAPMRCAVLPPVPVPYREPLFGLLAERDRIGLRVVYQSGSQPGWDQRPDWFPSLHPYEANVLESRQRARPGRTPVLVPRGLGAALSEFEPDCVVSWEYGAATLRALAWCRRRGRPLVVFSELTPATEPGLSPLRRRLHPLLAPRVAGLIAASSAARERLLRMGVPPARVEVSLQSADVEAFRAAAERRSGHSAPPRVLCVGRLVPDKNHELLIRAFAAAGAQGELLLCGAGPLEQRLRQEAARLGVVVRFLGYVPPAELPELYAEADALALVSGYEPFGAAVREAVAAALPIVCSTAAGAAGDLAVEGENALLVDPRDEPGLTEALRLLLGDPALRERLAAGSRAVTDRHPLERDAEAFERAVLRAAGG
jgi:glycosyltransferase involved in cell wall biosynthesis